MLDQLRGVVAPFTTPIRDDDSVDLGAIAAQVDWLISEGVHGLAAGGSTGEGHALTREEHRDILAETVRAVDGRVPVVAGIISNSTAETARSEGPRKKVVVVGGGPAGLEAARVSAARGHAVVLFEKAPEVGGQVMLASKAVWRQALSGIPRWLEGQVRKLGVELRLGVEASKEAVLAEDLIFWSQQLEGQPLNMIFYRLLLLVLICMTSIRQAYQG